MLYFATIEENNYKEAIQTAQPDLVIKLILPPEVSLQRKPDECFADVVKKHNIIKQLDFPESEIVVVDATMNFDDEIVLIHNAIWKKVLEKQGGGA